MAFLDFLADPFGLFGGGKSLPGLPGTGGGGWQMPGAKNFQLPGMDGLVATDSSGGPGGGLSLPGMPDMGGSGGGMMDMLNPMSMMGGGGGGGGMMSMLNPMSMMGGMMGGGGGGGGGSPTSGIAGVPGSILSGGSSADLYGRKPIIPAYPTGQDALGTAARGNLANLGTFQDLAARTNRANEDQITNMFRALNPGFDAANANVGRNLASETAGEIPQDVQDAVLNNAAARSMDSGTSGSGQHSNLVARDLGLTSLNLIDKGRAGTEAWNKSLRDSVMPHFFDVSQQFETPEQALQVANQGYNRDLLAAGVAAAPEPAIRGQFDTNMALLGMILSAYSGGPGYQNTYHPTQVGVNGGGGGYGGGGGMGNLDWGSGYDYNEPMGGWDVNGGGGGGGALENSLALFA